MNKDQSSTDVATRNQDKDRMEQRTLISEIKALSLACFHSAEEDYIDLQTAATAFQGIARLADMAERLDTV